MEIPYRDTNRLDYVCDYYDEGAYCFVFCVPNISRFIQFARKVKFMQLPKEKFRVYCFDFQAGFVQEALGGYVDIYQFPFSEFMDEWNYKRRKFTKVV